MDFDIRGPIGALFAAIGLLLLGYGLFGDRSIYELRSLGINVNLIWGGAMLAFGAVMLALAFTARRRRKRPGDDRS